MGSKNKQKKAVQPPADRAEAQSEGDALSAPLADFARPDGRECLAFCVGLVLATFAAFWPALGQGLVDWDDSLNLLQNERFRGFSKENLEWMFFETHVGHWQPLTWLSFALDWTLWGETWERYHLTSLVLHAGTAVLFLLAALRVFSVAGLRAQAKDPGRTRLWAAFVASLLFALHPLRVESVAWATERRDVLAGFFLTATVLFWLRSLEHSKLRLAWKALALLAFLLSLFSKAWGITLPAVLLVLDYWPLRRAKSLGGPSTLPRLLLEKVPFAVLAVGAAWIALRAQSAGAGGETAVMTLADHPLSHRITQAAYGLCFYVQKTLWPTGLSPLYELEVEFDPTRSRYLIALVLSVLATVACFVLRKRVPALLVAWLAFGIIVSPVSGLVQSGAQIAADRYTYLACLPFALLAAAALFQAPRLPAMGIGLAIAALLLFMSRQQTRVWADSETLWRHVVAVEPDSYVAQFNMAINHQRANRFDDAMVHYRLSVAAHPGEGNYLARLNLARLMRRQGDPQGAVTELFAGLDAAPSTWDFLTELENWRGPALRAELRGRWQTAVDADPEDWRGRFQFGEYLERLGDREAALVAWKASAAIGRTQTVPEASVPSRRIGIAYAQAGDWPLAEQNFREAVGIEQRVLGGPTEESLLGLGQALLQQGRGNEARMQFEHYLPRSAEAAALLERYGVR